MTNRSPLKWAGGKAGIIDKIKEHLPPAKRLVEPFVGSASVFLNTDYEEYLLADINHHVIDTFNRISKYPGSFTDNLKWLFAYRNDKANYLATRECFNNESVTQTELFIYLNRHCFNGICRYNKKGKFNVPYGNYENPYLPEKEIAYFAEKANKTITTFISQDFETTITQAKAGDVIYCDPPYLPASKTANFTTYSKDGFSIDDHLYLIDCLVDAACRGCHVVASNSLAAKKLYQDNGFTVNEIEAPRTISCKGKERKPVTEIIAVMGATQ